MYRICLIAEDKNAFSALRETLEPQGYEFVDVAPPAADGELVDAVKASSVDVVLLDFSCNGGFDVCQRLKANPETEVVPVIFMDRTANSNGGVLKSFESGADDFIPVEKKTEEILARLHAAIRVKQTLTQSRALNNQLNEMNTELYERNLQVEKELYTARQLQQSLLPSFIPEDEDAVPETLQAKTEPSATLHFSKCHYKDERLKISGVYLPCDALGGDIYDVITFPDGSIGVAIADVSGHGVPAGFITAIFKSSFYRITLNHKTPGDILYHLNNELADIVTTGEYVTAVYGRIRPEADGSALKLDYTGAGHPYPLYYKASEDKVYRLKENGTPLVWIKNMDYPMGEIRLEPGDRVLFFTDGLSEMRNIHGAIYSEEALEDLFLNLIHKKPARLLDDLITALSDFTEGHPLEDDLSVVLLEAS